MKSPTKLFDVLITETVFDVGQCFLPIADKFDIPVIGAITPRTWLVPEWNMGNPSNPAVYPSEIALYSYPMTFLQKLDNLKKLLLDLAFNRYYMLPELEKLYQIFFPHLDFADRRKMSLVFLNDQPVLTPRPMVPNIINVGGLHIQPLKLLPKVSHLLPSKLK